jgi:hypothetical protein
VKKDILSEVVVVYLLSSWGGSFPDDTGVVT